MWVQLIITAYIFLGLGMFIGILMFFADDNKRIVVMRRLHGEKILLKDDATISLWLGVILKGGALFILAWPVLLFSAIKDHTHLHIND